MLMSLDQFRRITGWHPLHFWGLSSNAVAPVTSSCVDLIRQYNWQYTDHIGRTELTQAITTAEEKLQRYLGYAVAERYAAVDTVWPHLAVDSDYRPWNLRTLNVPNEGHIAGFGTETLTLVGTGAPVYSSSVGAGFDDTATITIATTATDPATLRLYVPAADRVAQRTADGETWRIIPASVTIAGGFATFVIPSWLLVKPLLYESFALNTSSGIDPANAANYLTGLDVYAASDSANHGTAFYDRGAYPWFCCPSGDSDPASVASANIRSALVNPRYGIINPIVSVFNAGSGTWAAATWVDQCRAPDRLQLNIRAGIPREANGDMDNDWAKIVARLAMAEIQGVPCGCKAANHIWEWWQTDVSRTSGQDQYAFQETALNNPFGTKRGHIEAWMAVRRLQHVRGITTH